MMTTARNHFTKAEIFPIAAIENGVPALVEPREIIADSHAMMREAARALGILDRARLPNTGHLIGEWRPTR